MTNDWDTIGYVISSRYRVTVMRRLVDSPATPSKIANEAAVATTHISRALRELRERGLVELLVPEDRQKGRVYGVTETGSAVWERIEAEDLVS